jgi:hypothetical protein
MATRTDESRDRSMGELLRDLSEQTSTLFRQEVELAKAELSEKGRRLGTGAGYFGGAGLLGVFALAAFTAAVMAALATAMDFWIAAVIVGVVYAIGATILALSGRKQMEGATPVMPEQAIESSKEDVQWAKTQAQSGRR